MPVMHMLCCIIEYSLMIITACCAGHEYEDMGSGFGSKNNEPLLSDYREAVTSFSSDTEVDKEDHTYELL